MALEYWNSKYGKTRNSKENTVQSKHWPSKVHQKKSAILLKYYTWTLRKNDKSTPCNVQENTYIRYLTINNLLRISLKTGILKRIIYIKNNLFLKIIRRDKLNLSFGVADCTFFLQFWFFFFFENEKKIIFFLSEK